MPGPISCHPARSRGVAAANRGYQVRGCGGEPVVVLDARGVEPELRRLALARHVHVHGSPRSLEKKNRRYGPLCRTVGLTGRLCQLSRLSGIPLWRTTLEVDRPKRLAANANLPRGATLRMSLMARILLPAEPIAEADRWLRGRGWLRRRRSQRNAGTRQTRRRSVKQPDIRTEPRASFRLAAGRRLPTIATTCRSDSIVRADLG